MNTYSTYHECKSKNPNAVILKSQVRVSVYKAKSGKECSSKWKTCDHDEEVIAAMINKTEFAECEINKPKPRTKTEFVKCEFNHAWEAVKAFEDGEELYTKRSHKDFVLIDNAPDVLRFLYDLHRKVEAEIDERQEFVDAFKEHHSKWLGSSMGNLAANMFDSGKFKLTE